MGPSFLDRVNLKPACLLLSMCQAGVAAALGLGEVQVRSYLGQPLRASIALVEAPAGLDADCFSVEPGADRLAYPVHAQLSLERYEGTSVLRVRTRDAIREPVAQFVLVADCDVHLRRDYVVLLDPPPLAEPVREAPPPAAVQPGAGAAIAPAAPIPRSSTAAPLRTGATARPRSPARRAPASTVTAPRLVLSGKRVFSAATAPSFALKLDTRLPDVTQMRPTELTATELSDENTALTRKLAHLEAQLAALRQRNAELDRRRVVTPTTPAAAPATPEPRPRWPLYLLALGLVTGGAGLILWLVRRARSPRTLQFDDSTWTLLRDDEQLPAAMDDGLGQTQERMAEIAAPSPESGTEVKEDILDQAEVFMAHGHANLAIHLLQEHLRAAPTESPVPWLLLLDLLHRDGDAAGYAEASAECRRYFNVNLTDHPVSQDNDHSQGLEAYPHLLDQLVHVWNLPERDDFFKDLIYDHRGGTRMGFRPAAYRDILLLRAIAQTTPVPASVA